MARGVKRPGNDFEFKNVDGVWYRRSSKRQAKWQRLDVQIDETVVTRKKGTFAHNGDPRGEEVIVFKSKIGWK